MTGERLYSDHFMTNRDHRAQTAYLFVFKGLLSGAEYSAGGDNTQRGVTCR